MNETCGFWVECAMLYCNTVRYLGYLQCVFGDGTVFSKMNNFQVMNETRGFWVEYAMLLCNMVRCHGFLTLCVWRWYRFSQKWIIPGKEWNLWLLSGMILRVFKLRGDDIGKARYWADSNIDRRKSRSEKLYQMVQWKDFVGNNQL